MKYSIIVPIYKIEEYLEKCIASVLNQTYKNFELILVDDGSPDKCPMICDYYSEIDKRVKVIHKSNEGLVSARQAGCEVATGDYVINVDGDDWIEDNYLEVVNKHIDKTTPDVLKINAYYAYEEKNIMMKQIVNEGYYDRKSLEKNIFPYIVESKDCVRSAPAIWLHIVKRDLYYRCQMTVPRDITIGEDLACTALILMNAKNMYICNDYLYYYRQNMSSMTKNKSILDLYGPQKIAEHFEKQQLTDLFDFDEQTCRITIHLLFNACVSQFNEQNNYREIRKRIINVLREPFYNEIIKRCYYEKTIKGNIALFTLKYKLVILMLIKHIFENV